MPVIRFEEVSRDRATGLLYVAVNVWATRQAFNRGDPPRLTNDFLMQITATERRVRIDPATGWPMLAPEPGVPMNPALRVKGVAYDWLSESVTTDVRAAVRANVVAWLARATGRNDRGDLRTDPSRQRDAADPDGVLAQAAGLAGTDENA